jgi:phosphatidylglycerol:prolipoprotein diacylglycerol transferase
MLEVNHQVPDGWGLFPMIGPMPTYAVFMMAAFAAGIGLYFFNNRNQPKSHAEIGPIALAAFIGGLIGAKIPVILINLYYHGLSWNALLAGRTIAGGLLGGILSVWWIKRRLGIRKRFGNALAPSIALGMAIGRIGCFLSGCCFGKPMDLACGIDFGDHVLRYPTQLYEGAFCLIAFVVLQFRASRAAPGQALSAFFMSYFGFRFLIEFIRPHPQWLGLTTYQWICAAALISLAIKSRIKNASSDCGASAPTDAD